MRRLFVILLAGSVFAACSPKSAATIEGTVAGIADGTEVCLQDSKGTHLTHTNVAGGKFRIELAEAYPDQLALVLHGTPYAFPFFLEPGRITATIGVNTSSGPSVSFSGTPTNDAIKKLQEANVTTYEEQEQLFRNTVLENPNTVLAAYLVNGIAHSLTTTAQMDSVLTIIAGAPANAFTDRLMERRGILAASAVGSPALDFTQNRPDGTPFSLSSLRGKLVLIDFWASWCGPCRMENPNVVKLYDRFKDKGFEIVGVSLDNNRENWLGAIEADGLGWIHVSDLGGWNNAVAKQYAVRSIPHTVLVGPDGVIIAKNLRGAALEAKVAEVLGE